MLREQPISRKKQSFLLGMLIIILIITGFLIYKFFILEKGAGFPFLEKVPIFKESREEIISGEFVPLSELVKKLFENEKFRVLKPHGQLPVEVEKVGRSNPFVPFAKEEIEE